MSGLILPANATINASGTVGITGNYLSTNGTAVFWQTPSAGNANADAQYTWTDTQLFTNTFIHGGFKYIRDKRSRCYLI